MLHIFCNKNTLNKTEQWSWFHISFFAYLLSLPNDPSWLMSALIASDSNFLVHPTILGFVSGVCTSGMKSLRRESAKKNIETKKWQHSLMCSQMQLKMTASAYWSRSWCRTWWYSHWHIFWNPNAYSRKQKQIWQIQQGQLAQKCMTSSISMKQSACGIIS